MLENVIITCILLLFDNGIYFVYCISRVLIWWYLYVNNIYLFRNVENEYSNSECNTLCSNGSEDYKKYYTVMFNTSEHKILNYTLDYFKKKGIKYIVANNNNINKYDVRYSNGIFSSDNIITFTSERSYNLDVDIGKRKKITTTMKIIV